MEAGADVNARTGYGWPTLHLAAYGNTDAAAVTATVDALVAAGARVQARMYYTGEEPVHKAACNTNTEAAAAAVRALLVAGADALTFNYNGWTPLRYALQRNNSQAAEVLMAAMPTDAALEDLCRPESHLARQLLPAFIASRLPLTDAQWALIPNRCPGLTCALPAALDCSVDQACQVVRCLRRTPTQRLRTAALCLARVQRSMPQWPLQHLPLALVERILCSALEES